MRGTTHGDQATRRGSGASVRACRPRARASSPAWRPPPSPPPGTPPPASRQPQHRRAHRRHRESSPRPDRAARRHPCQSHHRGTPRRSHPAARAASRPPATEAVPGPARSPPVPPPGQIGVVDDPLGVHQRHRHRQPHPLTRLEQVLAPPRMLSPRNPGRRRCPAAHRRCFLSGQRRDSSDPIQLLVHVAAMAQTVSFSREGNQY